MAKKEIIKALYKQCKELNFDESTELVLDAENEEEQAFFEMVSNYFLQVRQREVVAQGKSPLHA